jgi:hypothetical protein
MMREIVNPGIDLGQCPTRSSIGAEQAMDNATPAPGRSSTLTLLIHYGIGNIPSAEMLV